MSRPFGLCQGTIRSVGEYSEYILGVHDRGIYKSIVDAAYKTHKNDAGNANPHAETLGAGRAESSDGTRLLIVDEHGLNNEQIVVERHNGVDQRYEHKYVKGHRTGSNTGRENEKLAEETRKRRNTGKREHGKHHRERQLGVSRIQVVVRVHIDTSGLVLYRRDNTESGKIGEYVYKYIEY